MNAGIWNAKNAIWNAATKLCHRPTRARDGCAGAPCIDRDAADDEEIEADQDHAVAHERHRQAREHPTQQQAIVISISRLWMSVRDAG